MLKIQKILLILLLSVPTLSLAKAQQGVSVSYGTGQWISYDSGNHFTNLFTEALPSSGLNGYRIAYIYQPESWSWFHRSLELYLEGSYGYWYTTASDVSGRSENIFALAPILRFTFLAQPSFAPFLEISVGPSALLNSQFASKERSFFMFQDMLGFGAVMGKTQRWFASVHAVHYSNANLMQPNHGITAPFMLTVGYYF